MNRTPARRKPSLKHAPSDDVSSNVLPLHHRIYIVLRRRLLEGVYVPDRPLPGEHQLAEDFQASRVTIRRVLERLGKDGLIVRRHGVGTFPARASESAVMQPGMSYFDYIAASSHTYDDQLLEFNYLPTPVFLTDIDSRFGAVTLKIVRIAFTKKVPLHIFRTYVPGDLAEHISRRLLGNKTVLEVLKSKGIAPHESELKIGAMSADLEEARLLRVTVGAPLVHAIRVSRMADGRAIEYNQMLSVAALFGYRFSFDARGTIRLPHMDVNSSR